MKKKSKSKNDRPERKFYPLPEDTRKILEATAPAKRAANFSLLFYRYLAFRGSDCSLSGRDKSDVWFEVRGSFSQGNTFRRPLFEALKKRTAALREGLIQRHFTVKELVLEAKSPLVLGFGLESVLEAGLLLHHTYGVPYLAGSSLKGLLRFWFALTREALVTELFGTQERAGILHLSDFLPESITDLEKDIINCHYQNYYAEKAPPTEAETPVPVYFLTIPQGAKFRGLIWLTDRTYAQHFDDVLTALEEALSEWGVGAKTAQGYGRMRVHAG